VQRDLGDPYQMHRTILHGFPTGKVEVKRNDDGAVGVLYRVDAQPQSGLPILLVQSQVAPDWSFLQAETFQNYLLPTDPWQGDENPAVKARMIEFQPEQLLAFRLRANPTRRLGKTAASNIGKRVGIYEEEKQLDWLQRKAEQSGFRLLRTQIVQGDKLQWEELRQIERRKTEENNTNQPDEKRPPKTGVLEVQFDGILQVTDPTAFLTAIQAGIGSGKAFGFGLLSVAPMR
jgi:CRISPR system Cascade subunit CasE